MGANWLALRIEGNRAGPGDAGDRDRDTLRVAGRIGLEGNCVDRLHVVGRTDQAGYISRGDTVLQEELVSRRGKLAGVVKHCFVLRGLADLLERGNGHCGQKADDDHDYHDFNEGETLGGTCIHFMWYVLLL